MEGKSDAKREFKKYLKEKEGQPINPQAKAAAERELELGRKGDFAVYRDEPSREQLIASYPKGRVSAEEAETGGLEEREERGPISTRDAISQISEMREIVERYNSAAGLTEEELKKAITELIVSKGIIANEMQPGQINISDKIRLMMEKISLKYGIRMASVREFKREIEELIKKYTEALESPRDKSLE